MQRTVVEIRLSKISPNCFFICESEVIEQLCVSIRRFGQLEPIEVWFAGEQFRILDGEKRYRACRKIGMKKIRAVIEQSDPPLYSQSRR